MPNGNLIKQFKKFTVEFFTSMNLKILKKNVQLIITFKPYNLNFYKIKVKIQ